MRTNLKTFFLKSLSYIILFIAIIFLGYTIGSKIIDLREEGAFVSWEAFVAPIKSERIVDATSLRIWVQIADGFIYEGNISCHSDKDCPPWQQVESVPNDLHEAGEVSLERSPDCNFEDFAHIKKVPGKAVECVRAQFRGPEYGGTTYYALLEDGTVYFWRHSSSMVEDFITLVFSTCISILIYVFGIVLLELKSRKIMRVAKGNNTG